MTQQQAFGIVGLGYIGGNLAQQALRSGMRVVGFDLHGPPADLTEAGLTAVESLGGLCEELPAPRIVLLYIPAGTAVDEVLSELGKVLSPGDVVVDGGNSYWGDSICRQRRLADMGLHFVDVGTSGGIEGAAEGACFMAGGRREAVRLVEPILKALSITGGYVYAGQPGAGHFVKLVHNGIEFGVLQAIGEGIALLERFRDDHELAELPDVLRCWNHGSVIRSWLIELLERSYRKGESNEVPNYVEDTGEVNWLIGDAMQMEVPVPITAQSVMQLLAFRDAHGHAARAIARMRHEFGGHPFGSDESIAKKRQTARLGSFPARAR